MTGTLHQNAPHRQRGGGKEVPPPIPLAWLARDAQVGFVDESGRLKRLIRVALPGKPGPRELSQFVIDFRHELAGRTRTVRILRSGGHQRSVYAERVLITSSLRPRFGGCDIGAA